MNLKDHGRLITEIWLPGEGNAYDQRLQAKDGVELQFSATSHGDHDAFWIVVKRNGVEASLINARQVTEIVWA